MDDRDPDQVLLQNHFTGAGALTALQMRHLPDEVQTRVMDAVRNGTGRFEPRTQIDGALRRWRWSLRTEVSRCG